MKYQRLLDLSKYSNSAFVFGPRMTGKTSLLRQIPNSVYFDLLDPELELRFRTQPAEFWRQINALPAKQTIIIDEVQRVPQLLDYVQMGIDRHEHQFFLSGSSARKLKRGAANLLGGRALDLRLHPLTHQELKNDFDLSKVLSFGSLPKISNLVSTGAIDEARMLLRSYYSTYIREEIQAEALVRNLAGFQRFLPVAASCDAREIVYANIARDCSVPDSTVKDFFSILEDTLIGRLLWPHNASERKKAHPKFYLFDCGITRMLLDRLVDPPTGQERGLLFESWFINEVFRLRDYSGKYTTLSFWKEGGKEVDLVAHSFDKMKIAVEIKSGEFAEADLDSLRSFKKKYPETPTILASMRATRAEKTDDGILILPPDQVIKVLMEKL